MAKKSIRKNQSETAYCMKCKCQTGIDGAKVVRLDNPKRVVNSLQGKCCECGTKVCKIIAGR